MSEAAATDHAGTPPVNSEAVRCGELLGDESRAPDANVEAVRAKLLARSKVGLLKYGTTTERKDVGEAGWLRHAQEEALDLAVYLERLIRDLEAASSPSDPDQR